MKKNLFVFVLFVVGMVGNSYSQNYQVHTLYMYSFTKYIKWPESYSEGDFVIGVLGESEIVSHLKKMASLKKVGDRLIRVVEYSSIEEVNKCNMLFVSESIKDFDKVMKKMHGTSTLIVTEHEGLGKKGSAINFIIRQNKLLFELNQTAIDQAGLLISQDLVKFAIMI